jgi:hypothetical protein
MLNSLSESFQAKGRATHHVCRDFKWVYVPPDCALDYYAKACTECGAVIETSPVPPSEQLF